MLFMKKAFLFIPLFFCFAFPAFAATTLIVNSADWTDVYSGMQYGFFIGESPTFLVSDRHSTLLLGSIPKGNSIRVLSSADQPFIIGYQSIIRGSGFADVNEEIHDDMNLELAKRLSDIRRFIVVDDSYAALSRSYVLFADNSNIAAVREFIQTRQAD